MCRAVKIALSRDEQRLVNVGLGIITPVYAALVVLLFAAVAVPLLLPHRGPATLAANPPLSSANHE